jgi:hypothetical protein
MFVVYGSQEVRKCFLSTPSAPAGFAKSKT